MKWSSIIMKPTSTIKQPRFWLHKNGDNEIYLFVCIRGGKHEGYDANPMFTRFVTFLRYTNRIGNHEKNMNVTNTKSTKHHKYSSLFNDITSNHNDEYKKLHKNMIGWYVQFPRCKIIWTQHILHPSNNKYNYKV